MVSATARSRAARARPRPAAPAPGRWPPPSAGARSGRRPVCRTRRAPPRSPGPIRRALRDAPASAFPAAGPPGSPVGTRDEPAGDAGLAGHESRQQARCPTMLMSRGTPPDTPCTRWRAGRVNSRWRVRRAHRQTMVHVGHGLPARQRSHVPAQRDALVQLRQVGIEQELRSCGCPTRTMRSSFRCRFPD